MKSHDKNTISSKMYSAGAYSTMSCLLSRHFEVQFPKNPYTFSNYLSLKTLQQPFAVLASMKGLTTKKSRCHPASTKKVSQAPCMGSHTVYQGTQPFCVQNCHVLNNIESSQDYATLLLAILPSSVPVGKFSVSSIVN